jgi:hypothetical protein
MNLTPDAKFINYNDKGIDQIILFGFAPAKPNQPCSPAESVKRYSGEGE